MIIKSYAKINLTLRVIKKLNNGLHDIQSNTCLINLFDKINIRKTKKNKDVIIFDGKFSKYIKRSNNSVVKTLSMLRKLNIIKSRYKISIEKNIPVFSGLGGGTSNSAFIIKYFLKKIDNKTLNFFEKQVGSDLRLFFQNQSYQKSLKSLIKYRKKINLNILIVYPNIKCSTKEVYSKVKKVSSRSKIDYTKISSQNKLVKEIMVQPNDLQEIVVKKHPKIRNIINYIDNQTGCYLSRMTGSGSACFGLFKTEKSAKDAQIIIKRLYPNYWSVVTKTI